MSADGLRSDPGTVTRRRFLTALALGGGATLLAACAAPAATPTQAPKAAEAPAQAAPATAPAKPAEPAAASAPAKPAPAADLDGLAQLAKPEGEVVIFLGRSGSRQLKESFSVFEKRFGIKATGVVGSGSENAEKVIAERDTGLFTADVWMGGLTTINTRLLPKGALDPIESQLVLPEVKDPSLWWQRRHWWGDPEKKVVFLFAASPSSILAFNTTLAKEDDIESWWDLLEPKWRGKIVSRDPTQAGSGGATSYMYTHPKLGPEFLRRLFTEADVTVTRDARQGAEWLALGKYSLYILNAGNDVQELRDQGMPVDDMVKPVKEGARVSSGGSGTISVFNRPAHPNAAKLFVNWWLSKEGQLTAMKFNNLDDSLREDISKEDVPPKYRRQTGVEYGFTDSEPEVLAREGEMLDFMKKVFESRR